MFCFYLIIFVSEFLHSPKAVLIFLIFGLMNINGPVIYAICFACLVNAVRKFSLDSIVHSFFGLCFICVASSDIASISGQQTSPYFNRTVLIAFTISVRSSSVNCGVCGGLLESN